MCTKLLSILSTLVLIHARVITASEQNHRSLEAAPEFPEECTWQCYLQQNPDLRKQLPWDENTAIRHYLTDGIKENRVCSCKVVILAGPHKASSTSLQSLAVFYSKMSKVPWEWLGDDAKDFAPFLSSYKRQPDLGGAWREFSWERYKDEMMTMYKEVSTNVAEEATEDEIKTKMLHFATLKEIYKHKLSNIFSQGYNIIFGSEEIDCSTMDGKSPLVDELLDIIPSKVVDHKSTNLMVSIVYRAPRAKHLKSMYGEENLKGENPNPRPYADYLCDTEHLKNTFHTIDSLALAKEFLQRGMKVQLFDMTSMDDSYEKKVELFSVLGCDVMHLRCMFDEELEQTIPKVFYYHSHKDQWIRELRKPKNVRDYSQFSDVINISDSQTEQIEDLLNKYDCGQYIQMMKYIENIELIYGHQFQPNMDKYCQGDENMTLDEMVQEVANIMQCENK